MIVTLDELKYIYTSMFVYAVNSLQFSPVLWPTTG